MDAEHLDDRRFHDNPYLEHNHMRLVDVGDDWAEVELTVHPDTLNPLGFAHGGALFSMADSAAGAAARADGRAYVTLSSSFSFLRSALLGDTVRARGAVRRRGQTTCYVDVDLTNQKGELLASGSFIFFHVPELNDRLG